MQYQRHIFVCTNQKTTGKSCCANHNSPAAVEYLKAALIEKGMHGPGKVRVSASGCLGRCKKGPCAVVYPEGVWYSYDSERDLQQIVEQHLINGSSIPTLDIDVETTA